MNGAIYNQVSKDLVIGILRVVALVPCLHSFGFFLCSLLLGSMQP